MLKDLERLYVLLEHQRSLMYAMARFERELRGGWSSPLYVKEMNKGREYHELMVTLRNLHSFLSKWSTLGLEFDAYHAED